MINYYTILEINDNASTEEIKASYRRLCKKWHPDKNPSDEATAKMRLIIEAYQILRDKERRERYDRYRQTKSNDYIRPEAKEEHKKQHQGDREKAKQETTQIFEEFLKELKSRGTRARNEAWRETKSQGKTLLIVFGVFLLIGLFVATSTKDSLVLDQEYTATENILNEPNDSDSKEWENYTSNMYSISYPSNWSILDFSSSTPPKVFIHRNSLYSDAIGISIIHVEAEDDLSSINKEGNSAFMYSGEFTDAKILENNRIKFKSHDCYKVVKTHKVGKEQVKNIEYQFKIQNMLYSIEIVHVTNEQDQQLGESIIRTFEQKK